MKTANYFLIAAASLAAVNCSGTPKTAAENTNIAWQNSSEIAAAQTPVSEKTAADQTAEIAPDALVKDLYKTHEKENGAIVQGKNRQILDKYFDKNLADLIWKDMTTNQNEVGVIDFDIFYNTQDADIKNLVVETPKIEGEKATVAVKFDNYTTKNTVTYSLVKTAAKWKIADINYGGADSLLKYFKDAAAEDSRTSTASGEFEGTYQIGETTCTVKPIKMAFEVKWAKGTGTEIFFSQDRANDRYIFASDPKTGKANVFAFDDENYNAGTFYRADGKEFPIKRVK